MAIQEIHRLRTCSKCGLEKNEDQFGCTQTKNGKRLLRAQCRDCYNAHRRSHYAIPEVHSEKQRKRKEYQSLPEVREARNVSRRTPEHREREKLAREKYRSVPENAAAIKAQRAEKRATATHRAGTLLFASKSRARRHSLPFDLDMSWVMDRISVGKCELTGIDFDFAKAPNDWCYNPCSPSIDQIVAGGGYKKSNCRMIITALNNALSQYGDYFFETMSAEFLKRRGFTVER
jgi:hypothetical protein